MSSSRSDARTDATQGRMTTSRVEGHVPVILLLHEGPQAPVVVAGGLERGGERLKLTPLRIDPPEGRTRRTLQGLAADVVKRIAGTHPRGPYRLLGWGQAGAVGYEIGVQLVGADQDVALVGVVDTGEASAGGSSPEHLAPVGERLARDYEAPNAGLPVSVFCVGRGRKWQDGHRWLTKLPASQVRPIVVAAMDARGETPGELPLEGAVAQELARAEAERREGDERGPSSPVTSVVTIQMGRSGSPPIFCVPGAGAGVTDFIPLASSLGAAWTIHGFQPRGMDGVLVPRSSVPAAAQAYLRELDKLWPRGAVNLVGHSFGGWVAFEMALQLQRAGRAEVCLTILDSEDPISEHRVGAEFTRIEALLRLISLYEQAAERPLEIGAAALEGKSAEAHLSLLHKGLVKVGLTSPRSNPAVLRGPVSTFETSVRTEYLPDGVFSGVARLVLVPAPGEGEAAASERFDASVTGWQSLAPNLEFRRGTGNHVTLLKSPNIGGVASWIASPRRAPGTGTGSIPSRGPWRYPASQKPQT